MENENKIEENIEVPREEKGEKKKKRDAKAELIMYLCGHNHQDRDAVSGGVLHISTGCDAYCKDDGMDRPVGMVDNTLFDLFLVDQDKRTVQVFRIGAGKDRAFSY